MPDTNVAVLATLLALAAALQMAIMSECFGTLAPVGPGLARSESLRFVKPGGWDPTLPHPALPQQRVHSMALSDVALF